MFYAKVNWNPAVGHMTSLRPLIIRQLLGFFRTLRFLFLCPNDAQTHESKRHT